MQRPLEQYGWVKTGGETYRKIVENKGITEIEFRDGKVYIMGEIDTLEELLALYNTAKQIKDESEVKGNMLMLSEEPGFDFEELQAIYETAKQIKEENKNV